MYSKNYTTKTIYIKSFFLSLVVNIAGVTKSSPIVKGIDNSAIMFLK